jgi:hypothetical protein
MAQYGVKPGDKLLKKKITRNESRKRIFIDALFGLGNTHPKVAR